MRLSIFISSLSVGLLAAASVWADSAPSTPPPANAPAPPVADTSGPPVRHAEPVEEDERSANNAIYVEGLGPALFYSINYDRSFGDFAARIGFGYVSVSATSSSGDTQQTASASFFSVPITVSYLGIGSKRNMLELGAGATIFHVGAGASGFDTSSSSSANGSATFVLPVGMVGYRLQPPGGGFVLRAGISPVFAGSSIPVLPWPYLALGGAF
jgi:hypothetical protein